MQFEKETTMRWVAFAAIVLSLAVVACVEGADLTPGQLSALYQRIDDSQKLSLAEKYDAKSRVLKASLEAGGAYTDAMDKLQRYTRIGSEATEKLRPEVGGVLSQLSERVKTAKDNPVFDTFGKISTGEGYVSQAVSLVSDLDKIQRNTKLPPSAQRELQILRGAAEAVLIASDLGVPVPNGLDCYAQSVKKLTEAVLQGAERIDKLKDGGFSLTEQAQMLTGLPPVDYRRTPLFDQGIPVVREVQGNERAYLQIEPGRWTEITKKFDYDQVAAIVSDYGCLYDGQNPTSREIVKYLVDSDARKKLADESFEHADYLITKDMHRDIAPDMPYPEFVEAKLRLKTTTDGLGLAVPTDSAMFRTILREQVANPGAYDTELRRIALQRWPDARDYLQFKGVLAIDTIPLDRLTELLDDCRRGGDRTEFVNWVAAGKPQQPATSKTKRTPPPPPRMKTPAPFPPKTRTAPPSTAKKTPPPLVKKSSAGGSSERPDEFKKDITHKPDPNFHFYFRPGQKNAYSR